MINKSTLHTLRQELSTLYYYSFDNLNGEQRQAFLRQIESIDAMIKSLEEF